VYDNLGLQSLFAVDVLEINVRVREHGGHLQTSFILHTKTLSDIGLV
jgi:hypothetical protein